MCTDGCSMLKQTNVLLKPSKQKTQHKPNPQHNNTTHKRHKHNPKPNNNTTKQTTNKTNRIASDKPESEINKEIAAVLRQINASVSFLPLHECPCMLCLFALLFVFASACFCLCCLLMSWVFRFCCCVVCTNRQF